MAWQIEPPIEIVFADDGMKKVFRTYEDLRDWAKNEVSEWSAFQNTTDAYKGHLTCYHIDYQYVDASQILEHAEGAIKEKSHTRRGHIENQFSKYNSRPCIKSDSPRGQHLIEMASQSPIRAMALLSVWNPSVLDLPALFNHLNAPPHQRTITYWIRGIADGLLFEQGNSSLRAEDLAYGVLRNQMETSLDEYRQQRDRVSEDMSKHKQELEKLHEDHSRGGKELFDEIKKTLSDMKDWYEKSLQLQIPVTYWSNKSDGDYPLDKEKMLTYIAP